MIVEKSFLKYGIKFKGETNMTTKNDISQVISDIINKRGFEIIKEPKILCSMLDDLAPQAFAERKVIRRTLTANNELCENLYSVYPFRETISSVEISKLKYMMNKDFGISDEWVEIIISSFGLKVKTSHSGNIGSSQDTCSMKVSAKLMIDGKKADYLGTMKNGQANGYGMAVFNNGDVYEGDFIDGKLMGKGKYIWVDGDIYEGDFKDDKRTGKGKLKWTNGDIYEGDYIDGKRTGKGKYIWTSGSIYEGDFIDGKFMGKGKFIWADGDIYEGDFKDDKRTGKGKLKWTNGDIYEGDFIDGKLMGKGKYIWADGDIYEGDFKDGNQTGKGKITWADKNTWKGEFRENEPWNGEGTWRYKDGSIVKGKWENGWYKLFG